MAWNLLWEKTAVLAKRRFAGMYRTWIWSGQYRNGRFVAAVVGLWCLVAGMEVWGQVPGVRFQPPEHVPADLLDDTLGWVGEEPILVRDFLMGYQKSAFRDTLRYTYRSLKAYWELYARFRQKLQEARRLGIDTIPRIRQEIQRYTRQLLNSFLTNHLVVDSALREAYRYRHKEVHLSVIQLGGSGGGEGSPEERRRRAQEIYESIRKGDVSFEEAVRRWSTDAVSRARAGKLGWFTALQLPYEIERRVMVSSPGTVLPPVALMGKFYIIRVDSVRAARGEVLTAHVFLRVLDWSDSTAVQRAQTMAQKVVEELRNETPFEEVARKYSEDVSTVRRGGVFRWFGPGETEPAYEYWAFRLAPGEWTPSPVKTAKGYYVIKVLKKRPIPPYDSFVVRYRQRIAKDFQRLNQVRQRVEAQLRDRWGIRPVEKNLKWFLKKYGDVLAGQDTVRLECRRGGKKVMIVREGGSPLRLVDFCRRLAGRRRPKHVSVEQWVRQQWQAWLQELTFAALAEHLSELSPEYARLLDEYRSGILLFEIMNQKVWLRALQDTVGLKAFFEREKRRQRWDTVAEALIVYVPANRGDLKTVVEKLFALRGVPTDSLMHRLRQEGGQALLIQHGAFLPHEHSVLKDLARRPGTYGPISSGQYVVYVRIDGFRPAQFRDIRARVITAYQNYLQRQWEEELAPRYPIRLNENVLRRLAQKPE